MRRAGCGVALLALTLALRGLGAVYAEDRRDDVTVLAPREVVIEEGR